MNKDVLIDIVQKYLNGTEINVDINPKQNMDAILAYYCRTAKRLIISYDLWKTEHNYWNDFLMAFRDFLLLFDTNIALNDIVIPDENDFAIKKDPVSGSYFATFQFPVGVIPDLAVQAYMRNIKYGKQKVSKYNLMTDSLIYLLTGFTHFKSLEQKLAVYGALNTPDGYTTMVSLPTGGGKSLITQMMAYQSDGLTIVVVPTVSLADDQVLSAKSIIKGRDVENEIFEYKSGVNIEPILKSIKSRTAKLLFISPESLMNNQAFDRVIREANKQHYLKNIVIDEAHIVIDWGSSFRVDYQCLEAWRKKQLLSNPSIRTILLSATFENRSVDILKTLFSDGVKWIEIRCDALRHEPRYMVLKEKTYKAKEKKMVELVRKLPHPMIIYVARPVDADYVQKVLNQNGIYNVHKYTGLTKANQRKELLIKWKEDRFGIMIATSAFGVGVDKSDVRTVLHLYIPQNANAYYQELGRGGRDRLPCLSVMCIHAEDINVTFQRINKRVMTTEKILGRWDSMYNNKSSKRDGAVIHINTSIKPNYSSKDEWDDSPASDTDMNWNIYVLLLFRRYGLIDIRSITIDEEVYIFSIVIVDDVLRKNDEEQLKRVEEIRSKEWDYYNAAYHIMENSIINIGQRCWSEMFFETYDRVHEHCSGCNYHMEINNSDSIEFVLKKAVRQPVSMIGADQNAFFGGQDEIVVISPGAEKMRALNALESLRLNCVIAHPEQLEEYRYFDTVYSKKNTIIIGSRELRELLKKGCYYYISGLVAIIYPMEEKEAFELYRLASKYLRNKEYIRLIHIIEGNVFFSALGKSFVELINGRVITSDRLF